MAGDVLITTTCPVCGKKYMPAPMHVYKVRGANGGMVFACSWRCVMDAERKAEQKRQRRRRTITKG